MDGDIFDRLMQLPILRVFEPFYRKNKEVLLYVFFGGLAFLVSLATFALFYSLCGINELAANVLSWIITVAFAFFTNRVWVFSAKTETAAAFIRQMAQFYAGRIATLIVEEGILYIFLTRLSFPALPVKIVAQIIVIVLNYVISKLWIFKKNQKGD